MAKIHIDLRRKGELRMRFPANINWTNQKTAVRFQLDDEATKTIKAECKRQLGFFNLVPRSLRGKEDELAPGVKK